jgi:CNT family concentrative nucleoside transporter
MPAHRKLRLHSRAAALALTIAFGFGLPLAGFLQHRARAETRPEGTSEVITQPAGLLAQTVFRPDTTSLADRARSVLGLGVLVGLCWGMSRQRRAIDWRLVGIGLGMQAVFAVFLLRLDIGKSTFNGANDAIVKLLDYSSEGAAFLFRSHVSGQWDPALQNFAFKVLPSIVFFSSLMAVLYHAGVMQIVIRAISWATQWSMRTSGAETLSTAANIFVGQTEAPLLVKPFVGTMTKSELLVIMAGGMANTAGGVLAAYVGMLYTFFPDIAGHLLAESIMSAPAALVTSKMLWPEDGEPTTRGTSRIDIPKIDSNVVESAARGASEGLSLAFNVAAMLIAFIALVSMLDGGLHWLTGSAGNWLARHLGSTSTVEGVTFQRLAGWVFVPFAWLMGTPLPDCQFIGELLGQKIVLNEFVAYGTLTKTLQEHHGLLSARAVLIATYALSGFANFSSIAIQIGGIGAMAPERRGDIAGLGILAMISGSFATFMTACFAAALV